MADEQTASERWIEERTLRYPTNPGKEYEYGLTPEEEGTQDAWAYDYRWRNICYAFLQR